MGSMSNFVGFNGIWWLCDRIARCSLGNMDIMGCKYYNYVDYLQSLNTLQ